MVLLGNFGLAPYSDHQCTAPHQHSNTLHSDQCSVQKITHCAKNGWCCSETLDSARAGTSAPEHKYTQVTSAQEHKYTSAHK